jgi:hypothetical protein
VDIAYVESPPPEGPWLLYGETKSAGWPLDRCVAIAHVPSAWEIFDSDRDVPGAASVAGLAVVLPQTGSGFSSAADVPFDLVANAFYFLCSWSERHGGTQARQLFADSVFARLALPQDIVDQYVARLASLLAAVETRLGRPARSGLAWPDNASYAIVLSHDVDFLPSGRLDAFAQCARTIVRHLVRQRDPPDAARSAAGFVRALIAGRDPYGCIPEIVAGERALGVRSSFEVAVARRHPRDVNYDIRDDSVRDYLTAITGAGFDLCLHGSYRSTECREWYPQEAALLAERLGRPLGSRQHYLAFHYDTLFEAQERAGIRYDMSMGFPDRIGARAGFSFPYFPYCLARERRYDVLEISLFFMDVTLQGYMRLKAGQARNVLFDALAALRARRGCVSLVWHPIVFGGARDPGYGRLYWDLVGEIAQGGGMATDGRTIDSIWRARARAYPSLC